MVQVLVVLDPRRNPYAFLQAVRCGHVADVHDALAVHPEWAVLSVDKFVPSNLSADFHSFGVLDCAIDALERDCSPNAHAVLRLLLAYGADPINRFEDDQDLSDGSAATELCFDPYNINPFAPQKWPYDASLDRVMRLIIDLMTRRARSEESDVSKTSVPTAGFSPSSSGQIDLSSLGYAPILERHRRIVARGLPKEHARWEDILCDLVEAAALGPTARSKGLSTWDDLCSQTPLMVARNAFFPGSLEMMNAFWDRRRLAVASGLYANDSWEVLSASWPSAPRPESDGSIDSLVGHPATAAPASGTNVDREPQVPRRRM